MGWMMWGHGIDMMTNFLCMRCNYECEASIERSRLVLYKIVGNFALMRLSNSTAKETNGSPARRPDTVEAGRKTGPRVGLFVALY